MQYYVCAWMLQGFVSYQLPSGNLSWSSTFREIETNKERLGIVDYSVSQTTLDQVRHYIVDVDCKVIVMVHSSF